VDARHDHGSWGKDGAVIPALLSKSMRPVRRHCSAVSASRS